MFEVVSLDVMIYSKRKQIVKIKYVKCDTMLAVGRESDRKWKT